MSLPTKEQLEKEIENESNPEVKKILRLKLNHIERVEGFTNEELWFFGIITLAAIGILGGLIFLGKLIIDMPCNQ